MSLSSEFRISEEDIGNITQRLISDIQDLDHAFKTFHDIINFLTGEGGAIKDMLIKASLLSIETSATQIHAKLSDALVSASKGCKEIQKTTHTIDTFHV